MNFFSYPFIDPVLIRVGPLEVRWYGLMYLLGFACAFLVIRSELKRKHGPIPFESADDLLFYLIVGMLIGARLGYAIFYNLGTYLAAPWEIFFIWHGGMSFHGGLVGMVIAGIDLFPTPERSFHGTCRHRCPRGPYRIDAGQNRKLHQW